MSNVTQINPSAPAAKPAPTRLLRLPEVEARTGLKRSLIYRLESEGTFPRRVKLTERASAWVEAEVDAFIEARVAARDAAR